MNFNIIFTFLEYNSIRDTGLIFQRGEIMVVWSELLAGWQKWWMITGCSREEEEYSLPAMIKEAGVELEQAYALINRVTDPDMVDYAVYTLKAAEKRYDYLYKQIKQQIKRPSFG